MMPDFKYCSDCRRFRNYPHKCDPVFMCRIPDYHGDRDDDWQEVRGWNEEEAAEYLAELYHQDGESDVHEEVIVEVKGGKGWSVTGEYEVVYSATEAADNTEGEC